MISSQSIFRNTELLAPLSKKAFIWTHSDVTNYLEDIYRHGGTC